MAVHARSEGARSTSTNAVCTCRAQERRRCRRRTIATRRAFRAAGSGSRGLDTAHITSRARQAGHGTNRAVRTSRARSGGFSRRRALETSWAVDTACPRRVRTCSASRGDHARCAGRANRASNAPRCANGYVGSADGRHVACRARRLATIGRNRGRAVLSDWALSALSGPRRGKLTSLARHLRANAVHAKQRLVRMRSAGRTVVSCRASDTSSRPWVRERTVLTDCHDATIDGSAGESSRTLRAALLASCREVTSKTLRGRIDISVDIRTLPTGRTVRAVPCSCTTEVARRARVSYGRHCGRAVITSATLNAERLLTCTVCTRCARSRGTDELGLRRALPAARTRSAVCCISFRKFSRQARNRHDPRHGAPVARRAGMARSITRCTVLALGAKHGSGAIQAGAACRAHHALHLSGNAVQPHGATDRGKVRVWAHVPRRAELAKASACKTIRTSMTDREGDVVCVGVETALASCWARRARGCARWGVETSC